VNYGVIIGIVAESYWPRINGVSNSVLRSAKYLESLGHKVVVITAGQNTKDEPLGTEVVRLPSLSIPTIHDYDLALTTKRKIEKLIKKYNFDILHVASPFVLGEIALRAAKELRVPSIAIYQTDVTGFAKYYGYAAVGKFSNFWLRHIHNLATINLVPSIWAKQKLSNLGVNNIALWKRGVDIESFNPKHKDLSLRLKWSSRADLFVGYVGRLAPEKNIEDLKLIPESPRIQVVIIGDGPSRYKLQEDMPKAIFTGRLTGLELSKAYASLDILIAPGRNETFCQVAQEGLASGNCVLAPSQGATQELIKHEKTGFIYDNAQDLDFTKIFQGLLINPSLIDNLAQQARASVEQNTWESVCDDLINFYQQALNLNPMKVAS
jgi:phosphatidylinositol alpha 1,6-mannosyltransferase